MKKTDLAVGLGISTTMVRRLAARGMPVDSVESAKRWRARNLDTTRTKQYRVDGNTGLPHQRKAPMPAVPGPKWKSASPHPGVAEANMHCSATLFALRFGIERYGPLLVHLGCVMTDDGHDVIQQALDNGEDLLPDIDDDVWEAIGNEYFELLPVGCPEAAEVECSGY